MMDEKLIYKEPKRRGENDFLRKNIKKPIRMNLLMLPRRAYEKVLSQKNNDRLHYENLTMQILLNM